MLSDFLACGKNDTIRFFFSHLRDLTEHLTLPEDETLYTASLLAHFALTSRESSEEMPPLANMSEVFQTFVLNLLVVGNESEHPGRLDHELAETAGAQTLLMAGFFRGQMSRRHNLAYCDRLGATFFSLSSTTCLNRERSQLLRRMAVHFSRWAEVCWNLNKAFRDLPYLIRPDIPPAT